MSTKPPFQTAQWFGAYEHGSQDACHVYQPGFLLPFYVNVSSTRYCRTYVIIYCFQAPKKKFEACDPRYVPLLLEAFAPHGGRAVSRTLKAKFVRGKTTYPKNSRLLPKKELIRKFTYFHWLIVTLWFYPASFEVSLISRIALSQHNKYDSLTVM